MFGLTGIYLKLAEFVVLIAFLFGCYFWIGNHAVDEYKTEQAIEQAKVNKAQQDKYNKLAEDFEALKLKRAANAITIQKETERIIERPVYLNACWDADGLHNANEAIRGNSSSPSTAVPANPTH